MTNPSHLCKQPPLVGDRLVMICNALAAVSVPSEPTDRLVLHYQSYLIQKGFRGILVCWWLLKTGIWMFQSS